MSRQTLVETLRKDIPNIEGKKLYIWGTGNTALLYQEGIKRLEKERFFEISGYCDNNSDKWGSVFCGKPVISPDELNKIKNTCALICSPQPKVYREVKEQLENLGGGRRVLN